MTTQKLKQHIDKVLGNNIRCLLPSYWWKQLFGLVVDKVEEVDVKIADLPTKKYVDDVVANVSIAVDDTMNDTSTNPVQNKVVKAYVDNKISTYADRCFYWTIKDTTDIATYNKLLYEKVIQEYRKGIVNPISFAIPQFMSPEVTSSSDGGNIVNISWILTEDGDILIQNIPLKYFTATSPSNYDIYISSNGVCKYVIRNRILTFYCDFSSQNAEALSAANIESFKLLDNNSADSAAKDAISLVSDYPIARLNYVKFVKDGNNVIFYGVEGSRAGNVAVDITIDCTVGKVSSYTPSKVRYSRLNEVQEYVDSKIIDNAVFGNDYYINNLTEGPISINFTEYYLRKSTIYFTAATDITVTVNVHNTPYKLIWKNGVPQLNPAKFYRLTLNEMTNGNIVPYLLIDAVLDEFDTETTE